MKVAGTSTYHVPGSRVLDLNICSCCVAGRWRLRRLSVERATRRAERWEHSAGIRDGTYLGVRRNLEERRLVPFALHEFVVLWNWSPSCLYLQFLQVLRLHHRSQHRCRSPYAYHCSTISRCLTTRETFSQPVTTPSSMSSGVDRPGLWSYFSFSKPSSQHSNGTTRRRASSSLLPRRDPFEKQARHAPTISIGGGSVYEGRTQGRMISGHVGRYIKAGGLIAFIVLVFLYLAPTERARVEQYVGGMAINFILYI